MTIMFSSPTLSYNLSVSLFSHSISFHFIRYVIQKYVTVKTKTKTEIEIEMKMKQECKRII